MHTHRVDIYMNRWIHKKTDEGEGPVIVQERCTSMVHRRGRYKQWKRDECQI